MGRKKAKPEPPAPTAKPKTGNNMIMYAVIFIAGFLCGIAFTVYKTSDSAPANVASQQQEHKHTEETDQAIMNLEAEVTANPDNFQNWIQLGNLYFDSNQPEKAIPAYEKSLELHSGNANIYTDLGVMYRRANQPKKAVETFDKAIALDASHIPSRFNKGIVLFYDLNDTDGAFAIWEAILKIDPEAALGNGEHLHSFIDRMKAELAKQ